MLVADDDIFFQGLLLGLLTPDYEIIVARDGVEAWHQLQQPDPPRLVILDWVMPGLSGPQVCRKVRASEGLSSTYLILLTARNNESDIIVGLNSGADDYIPKPPLRAELRTRIKMGERVLALQDAVKSQALTCNVKSEWRPLLDVPPALRSCAPVVGKNLSYDASCEIALQPDSDLHPFAASSPAKKRRTLLHHEYRLENCHSKQ